MSESNSETHLAITATKGGMLQLNKIDVKGEYLSEWNEHSKDFYALAMNGEIIRNTLYRKGGLNFNLKVGIDKYFMLLKYTECIYDLDFIQKCYPEKSKTEQEVLRKHLKSQWVIIDSYGDEKVIFDQFKHANLVNSMSPIYFIDGNYYNIDTGYFYCNASSSMSTKTVLILENKYDSDEAKKGIMKINLNDGTWEVFK